MDCSEKKAIVVGYEHGPSVIPLESLVKSFEILAKNVLKISLGSRITENRKNLVHPIHAIDGFFLASSLIDITSTISKLCLGNKPI